MIFIDTEFGCNCCNCKLWKPFEEEAQPKVLSAGNCSNWKTSNNKKVITLAWEFCSRGKEKGETDEN